MATILQREIEHLERNLLVLSAQAEENLRGAIKAVETRDLKLAREVTARDVEIDRMEVELEEECLKILALHQPVAGDLRFIVAILKINNDLERVGDLANNIAGQAKTLARLPEVPPPFDLHEMATAAWGMVGDSLDAVVELNAMKAEQVRAFDRTLDRIHKQNCTHLEELIHEHPESIAAYIAYLNVSRSLERIGDHATNVAEDVIYLMQGEIVRHDRQRSARKEGQPTVSVSLETSEEERV